MTSDGWKDEELGVIAAPAPDREPIREIVREELARQAAMAPVQVETKDGTVSLEAYRYGTILRAEVTEERVREIVAEELDRRRASPRRYRINCRKCGEGNFLAVPGSLPASEVSQGLLSRLWRWLM